MTAAPVDTAVGWPSAEEQALCRLLGIREDQFLEAKKANTDSGQRSINAAEEQAVMRHLLGGWHPDAASAGDAAATSIASCAFALPLPSAVATGDTVRVQFTPAGDFAPTDGRTMSPSHWRIDRAIAAKVVARFAARKNPAVLDYEHQTLHKEANGKPAPAAGWITALTWLDGVGLFGEVKLTDRARDAIARGEYRFVSPVFGYDKASGEVLDLRMAGLTNDPAIDGMQPLQVAAA